MFLEGGDLIPCSFGWPRHPSVYLVLLFSFFHSFIFPFPIFDCFESPLLCKCFLIFVFSLNMWYVSVGGIEVNRFILF